MAIDENGTEDDGMASWAEALQEQRSSEAGGIEPGGILSGEPSRSFSGAPPSGEIPISDINRVLDIPVQLSVELGRTRVPIKHILQHRLLGHGRLAFGPVSAKNFRTSAGGHRRRAR